ncbi:MAG: hypothetical protein ACH346_05490 [Chthoniobacterales bacterium]
MAPRVASAAIHVGGGSDRFAIGSADAPVTVNEFCAFLAVQPRCYINNLDQTLPIKNLPPSSEVASAVVKNSFFNNGYDYYDSLLMDSNSSQYCVIRSATSLNPFANDSDGFFLLGEPKSPSYLDDPENPWYSFAAKDGVGDFIIDAVISETVQNNFNAWRNYPTTKELCDYINNKVDSTNEEYCQSLIARYPSALIVNNQFAGSVFHKINGIVQNLALSQYSPEAGIALGYTFDADSVILFYVSDTTPMHVTVSEGKEYYRPAVIF